MAEYNVHKMFGVEVFHTLFGNGVVKTIEECYMHIDFEKRGKKV